MKEKYQQEVDYAFPLTYYREGKIQEQPGMRMIDYIAIQAMPNLLIISKEDLNLTLGEQLFKAISKDAYSIAEAMIKESENH